MSLPSCQGWLRRQANEASYDFWPDLLIGSALSGAGLVHERRSSAPPAALGTPAVYLMHKDQRGEWDINSWQAEQVDRAGTMRPAAANCAAPACETGLQNSLSNEGRQERGPCATEAPQSTSVSFIIEIGGRRTA